MAKYIFVNRFFYPDISATSQILSDLTNQLARKSDDVVVVTSRSRYDDPKARLPSTEIINGVKVIRLYSTSFGRGRIWSRVVDYLTFYVVMLWKMLWLTKRGDWIIAKTDPPLMSIPLLFIAKIKRAHLANWLQDIFPEVAEVAGFRIKIPAVHNFVLGAIYKLRDWSIRQANFTVVLSDEMKQLVHDRDIPNEKLMVVPNWADDARIQPLSNTQNTLRTQWGLQNKFVVGYSGNMGIAHDLDIIVEAARILKDRDDIVFLMIGNGFRKNFMIVDVQEQGLEHMVMFKPYQPRDQLSYSLGCADVQLVSLRPAMEGLIVPSKFYGVCAAGRPVIYLGLEESYIGRTIAQTGCGSVVSEAGEALAKTVLAYAQDPARRQAEGIAARTQVAEKNTVTDAARKWREKFDSTIA